MCVSYQSLLSPDLSTVVVPVLVFVIVYLKPVVIGDVPLDVISDPRSPVIFPVSASRGSVVAKQT